MGAPRLPDGRVNIRRQEKAEDREYPKWEVTHVPAGGGGEDDWAGG